MAENDKTRVIKLLEDILHEMKSTREAVSDLAYETKATRESVCDLAREIQSTTESVSTEPAWVDRLISEVRECSSGVRDLQTDLRLSHDPP